MTRFGEVKSSRSWIFGGFESEYVVKRPLKKLNVPDFIDRIVHDLIPKEAFTEEILTDIKGRDPQNISSRSWPLDLLPRSDELAFFSGKMFTDVLDDGGLASKPFTVSILTEFCDFVGAHHITHRCRVKRENFPDFILLRNIGRIFPIEIETFRFGVDIFQSRLSTFFLGYTPTVNQGLYIEYLAEELSIRIYGERLKTREERPLSETILPKLDRVTADLLGFSIVDDYKTT